LRYQKLASELAQASLPGTIQTKQKGASVMSDEVVDLYEGGVIFDEIEIEEAEEVIAPGFTLGG